MPDDHHDKNWTAIFLGAVAIIVAFWRGIASFCTAVKGLFALCTSVVSRLNAQDATLKFQGDKLKEQDVIMAGLQAKDQAQQVEIDGLKTQLAKARAEAVALQVELAAEKEKVAEKEFQIASMERDRNTKLLHQDALVTQQAIDHLPNQP